jgi:predicted nuclease with TOPRIM domain
VSALDPLADGLADAAALSHLEARIKSLLAENGQLRDNNRELGASLEAALKRIDELEGRMLLPATTRLQASVGLPPASADVAKRYRDFARSAYEHEEGVHIDDDEEVCADEDGAYITACIYVSSAQLEEDGVR